MLMTSSASCCQPGETTARQPARSSVAQCDSAQSVDVCTSHTLQENTQKCASDTSPFMSCCYSVLIDSSVHTTHDWQMKTVNSLATSN